MSARARHCIFATLLALSVSIVGTAPATANSGTRNFSSDTPGVIYAHPVSIANPPTSTAGGVPVNT